MDFVIISEIMDVSNVNGVISFLFQAFSSDVTNPLSHSLSYLFFCLHKPPKMFVFICSHLAQKFIWVFIEAYGKTWMNFWLIQLYWCMWGVSVWAANPLPLLASERLWMRSSHHRPDILRPPGTCMALPKSEQHARTRLRSSCPQQKTSMEHFSKKT